jgi:hypothetical protein
LKMNGLFPPAGGECTVRLNLEVTIELEMSNIRSDRAIGSLEIFKCIALLGRLPVL